MKKYQVIKKGGFKGSPDGALTLMYQENSVIAHAELGDDLAAIALKEKWIQLVKEENGPGKSQTEQK